MRLNAFGRELEVSRVGGRWKVFDLGNEGKKRLARDIVIPESIGESELVGYLSDLLHEHASGRHPEVRRID